MTIIASLVETASRFSRIMLGMHVIERSAMEKVGVMLETEAKRVLGTYDYGWAPLQPDTIARKSTGDSPLLETGELRDSIHHQINGLVLSMGSDNPKALWHEFGTRNMPARPFLSGAVYAKKDEIVHLIGMSTTEAIMAALISGRVVAPLGAGVVVAPQTVGQNVRGRVNRFFGKFR